LPPSRPTSSASGSTALFEAVDWIIAEQREFIAWWDDAVRGKGQPRKEMAQDAANSFSRDQAEKRTKILHQQVSRWRTGLGRPRLPRPAGQAELPQGLGRSSAEGKAAPL